MKRRSIRKYKSDAVEKVVVTIGLYVFKEIIALKRFLYEVIWVETVKQYFKALFAKCIFYHRYSICRKINNCQNAC